METVVASVQAYMGVGWGGQGQDAGEAGVEASSSGEVPGGVERGTRS